VRALAATLAGTERGEYLWDTLKFQGHPATIIAWEADRRRLFHWLPVCMGLGVLLAFVADGVPSPWPAATAAAGMSALALWNRDRLAVWSGAWAIAALFAGFALACLSMISAAHIVLERPAFARLSGFVETVERTAAGGRMTLSLTRFEAAGISKGPERVRVTFQGASPRAGDHVQGAARLSPPPQPALPGGYDFARDAWFLRLGAVGRWSGAVMLGPQPSPPERGLLWRAAIDNARTDLTQRIANWIGGQAGALSAALVTGKRGLISEPINEDLRAAGLYHIVSISGLHMVLAAGVFFWLFRAVLALMPGVADRWPVKKVAAVLAMAGASAYCIFSGSEVATVRSLIMTLVMLGAILVDRPAISMRNLAIAALIVMALEPHTILGPSFQMSFAAVAAMVAAHEVWSARQTDRAKEARIPTWGGRLLRIAGLAILASLATTLIASLATAPFAAYHFQRSNPYGLIGNALAIPFVSFVVMPAAVIGTLLLPFGLDGPIWQIMGIGSELVLVVAKKVAAIEGSVRGNRAFGAAALLLMTGGFLWLVLLGTRVRLLGLMPIVAGVTMAAAAPARDVFIDRDARIVAIRTADGGLGVLGKGTSRFVSDRWLAADGGGQLSRTGRCDAHGCIGFSKDGQPIALVHAAQAFEEDCARAVVLVTRLEAPKWCQPKLLLMDRDRLGDFGSTTLTFKANSSVASPILVEVTDARPEKGWKPWYGRPRELAAVLQPAPSSNTLPSVLPQPNIDAVSELESEAFQPPADVLREGE
jgi:competence protein ComEC